MDTNFETANDTDIEEKWLKLFDFQKSMHLIYSHCVLSFWRITIFVFLSSFQINYHQIKHWNYSDFIKTVSTENQATVFEYKSYVWFFDSSLLHEVTLHWFFNILLEVKLLVVLGIIERWFFVCFNWLLLNSFMFTWSPENISCLF